MAELRGSKRGLRRQPNRGPAGRSSIVLFALLSATLIVVGSSRPFAGVRDSVNAGGVEVTLEPLFDDQELDSRASTGTIYWEGAVRALSAGREVGRGYLELTGYGAPLRL